MKKIKKKFAQRSRFEEQDKITFRKTHTQKWDVYWFAINNNDRVVNTSPWYPRITTKNKKLKENYFFIQLQNIVLITLF